MSEIEVRELLPSEYKEWDLLVEEVQPGTLFHTSQWLEICRDILSQKSQDLRMFQKRRACGRMPRYCQGLQGGSESGTFDL